MNSLLRHPATLPTAGVLLLVYGAIVGSTGAILAAAGCLYLAWHVRRHQPIQKDPVGDSAVREYSTAMRRVIQVAVLVGLIWGALHAYWRLVELGWDRMWAILGAATVTAVIGVILYILVRGIVARRP